MRILLSGGTGYLGTRLAFALDQAGHTLTVIKRSTSKILSLEGLNPLTQIADIDVGGLASIKNKQFDCIIHTATEYGRSGEKPSEMLYPNIELPLLLLEFASSLKDIIFINTSSFYAVNKKRSPYTMMKKHAEDWVEYYAEKYDLRCVNARIGHMYGPYDSQHKIINVLISSFLNNVDTINLSPGMQRLDVIHVEDVVSAYMQLIENSHQLIQRGECHLVDIGTGETILFKELVEILREMTSTSTKLCFGARDYLAQEVMDWHADLHFLNKIGWRPGKGLLEGLRETVAAEAGRRKPSM